jgi:putative peptidoglycan lipid II flippase
MRLFITCQSRFSSLLLSDRHLATRRIFSSAALLTLVHLSVRFASMAKDLLLASKFGTSEQMDAFLIAFVVPAYFISVLGSTFAWALLPTYISVRDREGEEAASRFAGHLLVLVTLFLTGIVCAMIWLSASWLPLVAGQLTPDGFHAACRLSKILTVTVVASGASALLGSILNAERRILLPAMATVFAPMATIAAVFFTTNSRSIDTVAWGLAFGFCFETAILAICCGHWKLIRWPNGILLDSRISHVLKQYAPLFFGAVLMSSSAVIDQSMAASIGPGSVSSLNYGNKIVALIVSVIGLSIGATISPHYAQIAVSGRWLELRRTFQTHLTLLIICSVPIAIVLALSAHTIVSCLYQRGEFNAQSTNLVAQVQAAYALQIPFHLAGLLGGRVLSVLGYNRAHLWVCSWSVIINIAGNYLFRRWLGLPGIALSTSIVYISSSIIIYAMLLRRLNSLESSKSKSSVISQI